jgi:hypothetical protein
VALVIGLSALLLVVNACSCVSDGLAACSAARSADAIFTGFVHAAVIDGNTTRYSFNVTTNFRGAPSGQVEVLASNDGGMCDYTFAPLIEYVVYAGRCCAASPSELTS